MNSFKRFSSLILTLALALTAAACSGGGGTEVTESVKPVTSASSDTEAETTESTEAAPDLPDKDLKGFVFRLATPEQQSNLWSKMTFAVKEENGEIINDTILQRNRRAEEKYNCSFAVEEFKTVDETVKNQVMSGDMLYAAVLNRITNSSQLALAGYYLNLYDAPYLELDKSWWDQSMVRDLEVMGELFFINGSVILSAYDNIRTVMYNKSLAADLKITGLYDTVRDGDWTVEEMLALSKTAVVDKNGDGAMDYRDSFALLYNNDSYYTFLSSQNVKLADKDKSGTPFIAADNERFYSAYANILKIMTAGTVFNYNLDKYPELNARQAIVTMFDSKQALFFENGLSAAAQYMRNLENVDFGFLPCPKLDAKQEDYYSYVSLTAPIISIPFVNKGEILENAGLLLEALCYDSSTSLIPAYFDTCFSLKFTHDEESYEMLRISIASRIYDLGAIYNWGGISTVVSDSLKAKNENIASVIAATKAKADSELAATLEQFKKVRGK